MPRGVKKGKTKLTDEELNARRKEYVSTPEYKAKKRKYAKEHNQRPDVKARMKITGRKWKSKPENIEKAKKVRYDKRLKVLQHYSKHLSNSNIPCCRCCGVNSHIDFLEVDHIAGRKQMDSIAELVQIGYSSKLDGSNLRAWIIENNFPDGFQILCQNCNFAKGMKKNNNQCPHETARKEETFAMMEEQNSFEVGF